MAKALTIVTVARECGISKQYLCDIECGRRKNVGAPIAARLAASLDIPIAAIHPLTANLTPREQRSYADYYRALRSTVRANQAFEAVLELRKQVLELRTAARTGQNAAKILQAMETTIETLHNTLAYSSPRPLRRVTEGDDDKFVVGRRAMR